MKNILVTLYKIFDIIQTVLVWLAFFCVAIWFYRFFNLSYDGNGPIFGTIEYVPNIVRGMMPYMADFAGRLIDMSYFPASIILFILHLVIKMGVLESIEKMIKECLNNEIKVKENEQEAVNTELKENLKTSTLIYSYYAGILGLQIENPAENSFLTAQNTQKVQQENYEDIIRDLENNFSIKCEIRNNKVIFIDGNFANFDRMLLFLINKVKTLYKQNRAKALRTSFTLAFDATTDSKLNEVYLRTLEKISGFEYYNKIIATTLFTSRYKYNSNKTFTFETIGISRFFKKNINLNGRVSYETEDFDLYSLVPPKDLVDF